MFCRLLLWLGLAGALPAALRAGADVTAAWELVGRHLAGDALAGLQSGREHGSREAAFAEAVVRMDLQPVTDAGLRQVETRLAELARGSDEIADASAYLIGRLYQAHFFVRDYPRAAQEYERLAAKHPGSYWAQLGLVKLALLKLYVLPEPGEPAASFAAAEALLPRLTVPDLRRDAHIVIGRAGLYRGQPMDGVLAHLLEADRLGGLTGLRRGELQLQIGELSRREGHWEQARVFFQRFVDENEVDGRIYTVKAKLAEIAAQEQAEGKRP
jgi:tetratricopeptide (TPR) repeat protein